MLVKHDCCLKPADDERKAYFNLTNTESKNSAMKTKQKTMK